MKKLLIPVTMLPAIITLIVFGCAPMGTEELHYSKPAVAKAKRHTDTVADTVTFAQK